ncbi:MAG: hypothetical protein ABIV06_05050 [Thermoanaerobaculia bacterium]
MSLLAEVARRLQQGQIRCALIGAEALSLRAASRSTLDRDLLTTDPRSLDAALWQPLIDAGIHCEIRRGDAEDPLAGVVRITAADERPVDLIVGRHSWQTRILERSELLDLGDVVLPVPRASDLILLKLFAGGGQDAWDVAQLLAGEGREEVAAEVQQQLADLPADSRLLWKRILAG